MSDLGNKDVLSKNLQYYMNINNKTRNDVCDDLGFKYSTFSDWINAKKYPRIDKIEIMANYFNVTKSDLIEDNLNKINDIISIDSNDFIPIPIVGIVRAGFPILANENIEGYQFTYKKFISKDKSYFYLKVKGDSMDLKFPEGSLLLIEKTTQIDDGQIGVVLIDGEEATVKKIIMNNNMITLIPCSSNPAYLPKMYDMTKDKIQIIGKVKQSIVDYY